MQHIIEIPFISIYKLRKFRILLIRAGKCEIRLNSYRRKFTTMWRYYFDDSFQGAKPYTKPQEVSRNLKFVTNNTTNVCFDFGGRISRFLPMLVGGHEKIDGTIQKILP